MPASFAKDAGRPDLAVITSPSSACNRLVARIYPKRGHGSPSWFRSTRSCLAARGHPNDLEALEHRFDVVVHGEAFAFCLPGEVVAVGRQPPGPTAVAFALLPGKRIVHLRQGLDHDLCRTRDAARPARTVEPYGELTNARNR